MPGATVTYLVHVTRGPRLVAPRDHGHARMTARVFLSMTGALPRGVTATLSPRSSRSARATVTVRAAPSARAGTYRLRLSAQGRLRNDTRHPLRHARTVLTAVVAAPLRIRAQPATRSIAPGGTAGYEIRVSRRGRLIRQRGHGRRRLAARAWLNVAEPSPRGITATLDPDSTRTSRARLMLRTAASLPSGTYRVRLDAHGRLNRDPVRRAHTTVTLVVTSPSRVTFQISGSTTSMLAPGVSAPLDLSLTNDHGSALTVGAAGGARRCRAGPGGRRRAPVHARGLRRGAVLGRIRVPRAQLEHEQAECARHPGGTPAASRDDRPAAQPGRVQARHADAGLHGIGWGAAP